MKESELTDAQKAELVEARAAMTHLAESFFEKGDRLTLNRDQQVGLLAMVLEEVYKKGAREAVAMLVGDFEAHLKGEANQGELGQGSSPQGIAGDGFVMGGPTPKKTIVH